MRPSSCTTTRTSTPKKAVKLSSTVSTNHSQPQPRSDGLKAEARSTTTISTKSTTMCANITTERSFWLKTSVKMIWSCINAKLRWVCDREVNPVKIFKPSFASSEWSRNQAWKCDTRCRPSARQIRRLQVHQQHRIHRLADQESPAIDWTADFVSKQRRKWSVSGDVSLMA